MVFEILGSVQRSQKNSVVSSPRVSRNEPCRLVVVSRDVFMTGCFLSVCDRFRGVARVRAGVSTRISYGTRRSYAMIFEMPVKNSVMNSV